MSIIQLQISQKEFNAFLAQRKHVLPDYEMNKWELFDYVKRNPENTTQEIVDHKVYLLNKFSSTRVPRKDMVDTILRIKNIDKRLKAGDPELVHEIANSSKSYYSFATKYCALHQPDKYPIFDNLVWNFLTYLGKQKFFDDSTHNLFNTIKTSTNGYRNYIKIYDEFILKSGVKPFFKSYDNVDYYVWGYIQIYIRYHKCYDKANELFPDIFKGIISCAIWEIIKNLFV